MKSNSFVNIVIQTAKPFASRSCFKSLLKRNLSGFHTIGFLEVFFLLLNSYESITEPSPACLI